MFLLICMHAFPSDECSCNPSYLHTNWVNGNSDRRSNYKKCNICMHDEVTFEPFQNRAGLECQEMY